MRHTAAGLFLTLLITVFALNFSINVLTNFLALPPIYESIVDSILLVLFAYTILYFLTFKPMATEISERQEAESQTRKLAAIVESSDDAIIGKSLKGEILTWNKGAAKLYGYTFEEVKGKPVSMLAPAEYSNETLEFLRRIGHGESINHYETIRRKKSGEQIYVSLTISPMRDTGGKIVGASTIARDITGKKLSEELLRHAKEQAELLFRITPSAIFTLDTELRITSWNDKAEDITGYSQKDLLGKTCSSFTDLPCNIECTFSEKGLPKPATGQECRIRNKDGRILTIIKNIDYVKDSKGNMVGVIESFEDITLRKKLEEDLRKSRDYLNKIINSVADPIFVKDRQHRLLMVNDAYCTFIGYPARSVIGKTDYDFFPKKQVEVFLEKDKIVFNTGVENINEEEITDSLGKIHSIATKKALYVDDNGEKFIVGVIRDITERKRIEKLKDDFIGTVSHELRTPLSITKEGVSLVLDKIPGPINEQQARILTVSKNNIDRLARMINSLLDISRIESGKMALKIENIDLPALIRQVASSFEIKTKEKGLSIRAMLPEKAIFIEADSDAIAQVLTNLIANSVKFTAKGYIDIILNSSGNDVEVSVSDTGIGISMDDMPKLFDKFRQFGRVNGPGEKGTGLGLAIAKGIIAAHKGLIWAESELGKGTKISFTLPKKRG